MPPNRRLSRSDANSPQIEQPRVPLPSCFWLHVRTEVKTPKIDTPARFCLHTALPWNVFCRDCIVWGSKFGGLSMEKIILLCLIVGVIGVLAELSPVLPPLK